MLWLDGVWPRGADTSEPGVERGSCPADSGVPADVIAQNPEAYVHPKLFPNSPSNRGMKTDNISSHVTWSNIRFGPIGSTTEFS